ncbi:hypothetical protein [Acinetobacter towneri]|uniref:hypothetical protein n=1 Tax=Acinetobacter towneri TaxID=202956 RepID=UPI003A83A049
MSTVQEKRDQMAGSHFTQREKDFMRIYAAKNRTTISNAIRETIADKFSKIEDPENPFYNAKNNT